jgi:two-component system, cell cycle sensor histidine kinase and response regulator CckA
MSDTPQVRVLLVEDDEDDYVLTRGLFTEMTGCQFKLEWFKSYHLGLEAMVRNQHDVCLVDYRLGSQNGIELLSTAIKRGCQAPIILLTGLGEHEVDVQAMKAGAADYLVKAALRADSLERSIRYAMERKRAAAVAAFEQASLAAFGAEIGLALTGRESMGVILHRCADCMVRYLNVHLAQVWILEQGDSAFQLRATAGALNDLNTTANPFTKLPCEKHLPAAGKPLLINQITPQDERVPCVEWVRHEKLVAYASHPLMLESRLIGLVSVYSLAPLSQAVIQEMGSVSNGIALYIERKRSEEALDASEVKYRSVVNSLKEVVFQVNEFGHWTSLNPAWSDITGFESKETIGTLFLEYIHHDDRPRNSHIFLQLLERKLDYCRYETRLLTKDGKVRWVEIYAQLTLNNDGGILGSSGSLTDITDRKHAENQIQKLAAFPRVNPNPVLEFDAQGALTYFNDAAQEMAAALGEKHPRDILPPNAADLARQALGFNEKKLNVEVAMAGKTISWSFFPITGSHVVHCYGVDITDMENLEAQFRQAQKMESIGQLAAGVAHDFNNILTVIQGYADLLKARYDGDAELAGPLKQISDASRRASALTRQLLMFSRKQVLQPKVLDLNAVLRNLHNMLTRLLGEHIAVENNFADTVPSIEADTGMLEQIVMNLAVNARDAMPKGGKLVIETATAEIDAQYVRQRPDARPGQYVRLSVTDSGTGMDRKTLERIFEPFFSTKPVGKGTGLGLATVYGIVKQHKGWVEVKSELGVGTTFDVYIPAAQSAAEPAAERVAEAAPAACGGNETILLVEDEQTLREWVREILQGVGYRIVEAANGVEALKAWDEQSGRIDLLLTDMVMPEGLTGRDLARQLKSRQPGLKVVYTSGYSEEILSNEAELRDAPFLPKPYHAPQLTKLVRELLDAKPAAVPASV